MPIVQIHLPKNCADEATLERIRVACRQHVLDTLSADRAHHDYVTVVEVLGNLDAFGALKRALCVWR